MLPYATIAARVSQIHRRIDGFQFKVKAAQAGLSVPVAEATCSEVERTRERSFVAFSLQETTLDDRRLAFPISAEWSELAEKVLARMQGSTL